LNHLSAILPSVYLGPLSWYDKLFRYPEIVVEKHEHYRKQTWRNRCRIAGPNSVQDLVIPLHHDGNHTPMHAVRIDYRQSWQAKHWRSITAAYANSPFFDFYAEKLAPFYEKREWEMLVDYNTALFSVTMDLLKRNVSWKFSDEYVTELPNTDDYRLSISPKAKTSDFHPRRYVQVFEERHGFIPDLSIIDLLCCAGPEAGSFFTTFSERK
jgi:hypothetical protein